jgi:outer membrane protein OmpA-like peptidoglycan-associated protein
MAPVWSPGDPPQSGGRGQAPSNLTWGPPPADIALVRGAPRNPRSMALIAPAGGGAVASINFASGSTRLGAADEARLRDVAELYRRSGGRVSIIGHASASAAERADVRRQIANFSMSMDRANVVAQALQRYGVPAGAIEISAQVADAARADVFFLR